MGFTKHGTGRLLPDAEQQKTASKENWTEEDQEALEAENDAADEEEERR